MTTLYLSNKDGLCATGQNDGYLQNIQVLFLGLGVVNGQSLQAPTEAGVYSVAESSPSNGDKIASATAAAVANCEFGSGYPATGGTVTIASITTGSDGLPSHLSGTLALQFAGGDSMNGPFSADLCAGNFQLLIQFCPR